VGVEFSLPVKLLLCWRGIFLNSTTEHPEKKVKEGKKERRKEEKLRMV